MCLHTAAVFAVSPNTRNTVRGKIVNETGEPIIGAIVTLKGNKNGGTTTDADGNFVLAYNDHQPEPLNVNYIDQGGLYVRSEQEHCYGEKRHHRQPHLPLVLMEISVD